MKLQRNRGFTLIELMIVVAIIAIITALAIPRYQSYVARTQFSEANSLLAGTQVTIEERLYRQGFGNVMFNGSNCDPATLRDDLGLQTDGRHGAITDCTDDDEQFDITYTFGDDGADNRESAVSDALNGGTVRLIATPDNSSQLLLWRCELTDIANRYLSGFCDI